MYHSYENWKDDRGTRQKSGEVLSGAHPPILFPIIFVQEEDTEAEQFKKKDYGR